jgi:YD repeat-containing protein
LAIIFYGVFVDVDRHPPEVVTSYRTRKIQGEKMKVIYDLNTDTLMLEFKQGPVVESDEDKPGTILDYDAEGNIVSIEILDASKHVEDACNMQFEVAA